MFQTEIQRKRYFLYCNKHPNIYLPPCFRKILKENYWKTLEYFEFSIPNKFEWEIAPDIIIIDSTTTFHFSKPINEVANYNTSISQENKLEI